MINNSEKDKEKDKDKSHKKIGNEDFLERRYYHIARLIILSGIVALIVLNIGGITGYLGKITTVLRPVIIGLVFAYIINLPMKSIEKVYFPNSKSKYIDGSRRIVSILLSIIIIFSVIGLILVLVLPQVSSAVKVLVDKVPKIYESGNNFISQKVQQQPNLQQMLNHINQNIEGLFSKFVSKSGDLAGGAFNITISAIGGILDFVLGIMFAIYILLSKENLVRQTHKLGAAYVSNEKLKKLKEILKVADDTFSGYITGQMVEALVVGTLFTVALLIFRFPYATMIGSITGLTTLIPILGAFVSGILGFLMILTVDPIKALFFILAVIILQQIDGAFIYPRIVGGSVGIPALWVLAAITIGGGLFGIVGTLIGVPVMATIYKLLSMEVDQKIKDKAMKKDIGITDNDGLSLK